MPKETQKPDCAAILMAPVVGKAPAVDGESLLIRRKQHGKRVLPMLNHIWLGMLVIGFVVSIMSGKVEEVTAAAIDSASQAVELSISLLGIMCLWTGLMNIAEKSGLVRYISRRLRLVLKFLFPEIPARHPAMGAVVMNLAANILGLGNAATPLGLKAMTELDKLNPKKSVATDAMCMFLVLNTSIMQLIPATVIAIRAACGSSNPSEIIAPVWAVSALSMAVGILAVKFLSRFN